MKADKFVQKEVISKDYGKVFVEGKVKGSRTLVNVKVLQRGKGWDDTTQQYTKYFRGKTIQDDGSYSLNWGYTHRDEYGKTDTVHIKTLKQLES